MSPSSPSDSVRPRIKRGATLLWIHRLPERHGRAAEIEAGEVIGVYEDRIELVWLEGHKSRNDSVTFDDVVAVYDPRGSQVAIFPFRIRGHVTEAGRRWLVDHPEDVSRCVPEER